MGDLVDSLVRVFEFLIQGMLALVVVGFALVFVHPVKESVFQHLGAIHRYLLGKTPVPNEAIILVALGLLYFLGVFTNVVGYWLLEPVHHAVILDAEKVNLVSAPDAVSPSATLNGAHLLSRRVLYPLRIFLDDQAKREGTGGYATYIRDEVQWRNCNIEALKHALDPLFKQSRIIRGTIICSLAFCVVALLKFFYFGLVWILFHMPRRCTSLAGWLYRHTVHPTILEPAPDDDKARPSSQGSKPSRRAYDAEIRLTRRYALSSLTLSALAALLYLLALAGWQTIEKEYHLMARVGASTACKAVAVSDQTPNKGAAPGG